MIGCCNVQSTSEYLACAVILTDFFPLHFLFVFSMFLFLLFFFCFGGGGLFLFSLIFSFLLIVKNTTTTRALVVSCLCGLNVNPVFTVGIEIHAFLVPFSLICFLKTLLLLFFLENGDVKQKLVGFFFCSGSHIFMKSLLVFYFKKKKKK